MTVQSILEQLKSSKTPVAKSFHVGDHFKVLIFGFAGGMKLEEHDASMPTKLLVLNGEIIYRQNNRDIRLKQHDEVTIEPEMPHSVEAVSDSLILLTQG
jgi:quercetin dioxygenase-like cupin family protein